MSAIIICVRCGSQKVTTARGSDQVECQGCGVHLGTLATGGVALTEHGFDIAPLVKLGKITAHRNGADVYYAWHNPAQRVPGYHDGNPESEAILIDIAPDETASAIVDAYIREFRKRETAVRERALATIESGGTVFFSIHVATEAKGVNGAQRETGDVLAIVEMHTHDGKRSGTRTRTLNLDKCPRCHTPHHDLFFWSLNIPVAGGGKRYNFFAICPTLSQPILLQANGGGRNDGTIA